MIDALEGIDRAIVLAVNGCNTPWLDQCMWILSKTGVWIPAYAFLLYLVYRNYGWKSTLLFTILAFGLVALVDSSTTFIFKETIQRYRPSHHLWLTNLLHYHQFEDGSVYQGGTYGFFSSHASNNAAIAFFSWCSLKNYYPKLKWFLILGVAIICYSRLYLGVHYLSDLLAGALWGVLLATAFFVIFKYIRTKAKL